MYCVCSCAYLGNTTDIDTDRQADRHRTDNHRHRHKQPDRQTQDRRRTSQLQALYNLLASGQRRLKAPPRGRNCTAAKRGGKRKPGQTPRQKLKGAPAAVTGSRGNKPKAETEAAGGRNRPCSMATITSSSRAILVHSLSGEAVSGEWSATTVYDQLQSQQSSTAAEQSSARAGAQSLDAVRNLAARTRVPSQMLSQGNPQ